MQNLAHRCSQQTNCHSCNKSCISLSDQKKIIPFFVNPIQSVAGFTNVVKAADSVAVPSIRSSVSSANTENSIRLTTKIFGEKTNKIDS